MHGKKPSKVSDTVPGLNLLFDCFNKVLGYPSILNSFFVGPIGLSRESVNVALQRIGLKLIPLDVISAAVHNHSLILENDFVIKRNIAYNGVRIESADAWQVDETAIYQT